LVDLMLVLAAACFSYITECIN